MLKDLEAKLGPIDLSLKPKDAEKGGELNDRKEENTGFLPRKEEYVKPPNGKEEGLESHDKQVQCKDSSSTAKSAVSSPRQEENVNFLDKKEERKESSLMKEKSPEPTVEREILKEPPARKEEKESIMEKAVHAQSPTEGDDHTQSLAK